MVEMPRSLDDVDWPLRTERLVIRRATADDLDATWRYRRLPEISEWLTGAPQTRGAFAEKFLNALKGAPDVRKDLAPKRP